MAATLVRPSSLAKRRETKLERDLRQFKDGDPGSDMIQDYQAIGLADATGFNVVTVTVPNANHTAAIGIFALAGLGDQDSAEASYWTVAISRIAGAATKVTVSSKSSNVNTTGATANAALTIAASSISGAVTAVQSFTLTAAVARSAGTSTNHDVVLQAQLLNARAGGIALT